jgi:phosphopantothenoylcysteine decarboxylase/phosphopantothenate--cysteine ligase
MGKPLTDRRIVVGITGSIAAYKACELIRRLREAGAEVQTVLTEHGQAFIGEQTLLTLSGRRVLMDLFSTGNRWEPEHVAVSDWAEACIVAPATANVIGKVAAGIADDVLTSLVMAMRCPVVFAPAMNVKMYENPIVQANIEKLKGLGYEFVEPDSGYLACGYEGKGRLAETHKLVAALERLLTKS